MKVIKAGTRIRIYTNWSFSLKNCQSEKLTPPHLKPFKYVYKLFKSKPLGCVLIASNINDHNTFSDVFQNKMLMFTISIPIRTQFINLSWLKTAQSDWVSEGVRDGGREQISSYSSNRLCAICEFCHEPSVSPQVSTSCRTDRGEKIWMGKTNTPSWLTALN